MRALALGLSLLALAAAGVLWRSRAALRRGDAAEAQGDHAAALGAWREAERWSLPAAPWPELARQRLAAAGAGSRPAPDPGVGMGVAAAGLLIWLGGAAVFAWRGLGTGGELRGRWTSLSALLVAGGLALYFAGLGAG